MCEKCGYALWGRKLSQFQPIDKQTDKQQLQKKYPILRANNTHSCLPLVYSSGTEVIIHHSRDVPINKLRLKMQIISRCPHGRVKNKLSILTAFHNLSLTLTERQVFFLPKLNF